MLQLTDISIEGRTIGEGHRPFVIAEMSGNHNHSLERALEIVEVAAKTGVDALKIQTYTPDTMTLNINTGDFFISDPKNLWHGRSLYDLYSEAYTPWEWHAPIFSRCRELGVVPFSTPFDNTAVDFLEELGSSLYKIASFENTDLPLLRKVAQTGKPIIMSTGMATAAELDLSVRTLKEAGCQDLVLLKCTSTYPAEATNTNVSTIPHMRELFGCHVGLSDHTMGLGVAVAATALGARVVEKHFTLARADGGVDASFSLEPSEMAALVLETTRAWQSLGQVSYGPSEAERNSLKHRRSLYIAQDMQQGEVFTPENLRSIRPGLGLAPKYYDLVLGSVATRNLARGTALSYEHFA